MKRLASILSWVLLLTSGVAVIAIATGKLPSSSATVAHLSEESVPPRAQDAFADFPLDTSRTIDFDLDENTMDQLTPREQLDQKRDWLLYTVVANSDASADALNRSLYDVAPVRHGYLRQVSRFEYGLTRSCVLGDDQVIALVPKAVDAKQRADDIAHIFDEARKNLGSVPGELAVFEYSFDAPDKATLTRRASLAGRTLLESAAGYHEASVSTLDDLEKFMASIDDLVFARDEGDSLKLGGRKLANAQYRNIRVEDVAAIWQAEEKIQADLRDFRDRWDRRAHDFNSNWHRAKRYASQSEYDRAFKNEVQKPHDEEQARLRLVSASGFSLDPAYDYVGLVAALAKPTLTELLDLLFVGGHTELAILDILDEANSLKIGTLAALLKAAQVPDDMLRSAVAALQRQPFATAPEPDPFLKISLAGISGEGTQRIKDSAKPELPFLRMKKLCEDRERGGDRNASLAAFILRRLDILYRFQVARYDGPINGTEVGMVLFYTDLLAKIWGQDFARSTPSSAIAGFEPQTRLLLPTIYRAELIELPNTRLWFGPEDNGYQIVDTSTLHFARNATRIYAASSNPLEPGREVAPNASSEAFLSWWNDHYDEVAQYEPEYQRLNQIMKWSLLISWLNSANAGKHLGALAAVPVDHSAWFPAWVRKSPQLRFRDWDRVGFFSRGHLSTTTEAMPILVSYGFNSFADEDPEDLAWEIEGGVSLASKEVLKTRPLLRTELPALMRRSGLDYSKMSAEGEKLVTFRGTAYEFSKANKGASRFGIQGVGREVASLKIAAKDGLKFRARFGEMAEGRFTRIVERVGLNVRIEGRAAAGEIGHLNIAPSRNGFRVAWRAREVDDGYAIARRLSSSLDFTAALKNDPLVEVAIAEKATGAYYVKSHGSRKWMKIAPESGPSPDVPSGWTGRIADITPNARPVNIAWLDEAQIPAELRNGGNWVRGPPRSRSGGIPGSPEELPIGGGRDLHQATKAILADPIAYKRFLDAQFKEQLGEIDGLLADGLPQKALAAIEEGLYAFGGHEQLHFREALAQLANRRPSAAADAVNNIKLANRRQSELLIDEVNSRLREASDPAVRRIAESADWRTATAKPPGDEVLLTATQEGALYHELRIADMPKGSPVKLNTVPDDALVYYQDSPELNVIDWNVSVKASLDQVAGLGVADVIELPRADIAHFNPAHIYSGKTTFSRAGGRGMTGATASANTYRAWTGSSSNGSGDGDDEEDEREGKVYLVVVRPAAG